MPVPKKRKIGRPEGTTRANGYKTSPGRPTGLLRGWKKFEHKIGSGFKNLLQSK